MIIKFSVIANGLTFEKTASSLDEARQQLDDVEQMLERNRLDTVVADPDVAGLPQSVFDDPHMAMRQQEVEDMPDLR